MLKKLAYRLLPLSVLGIMLLLLSPLPSSANSWSPTVFNPQQKLSAPAPFNDDEFGVAVDVDGNFMVVGAHEDKNSSRSGSAYVYFRTGNSFVFQQELSPSDVALNSRFGTSVAIEGNTILVGADQQDGGLGAVYVFVYDGNVWSQQAKLTASSNYERFGRSLDIDGNNALIGATDSGRGAQSYGEAFIFQRVGSTWLQKAKLNAGSDAEPDDGFGVSVSISGNVAIVGAPRWNNLSGAVYPFVFDNGAWVKYGRITPLDPETDAYFGSNVSVSGTTVLIGNAGKDPGGNAYTFVLSGTAFVQQAKLTACCGDNNLDDQFGYYVALDGDTAVVGALNDDQGGSNAGAAYVFTRENGAWTQAQKLTASDAESGAQFGNAVGISENTIVVGAWRDNNFYNDAGAAYVFTAPITEEPVFLPGNRVWNAGFEEAGSHHRLAQGWTINNTQGNRRRCNNEVRKIAFESECFYQFKGFAGQRAILSRLPNGSNLTSGTLLRLNFYANTIGVQGGPFLVRAIIRNSANDRQVVTVRLPENTTGWQHFYQDFTINIPHNMDAIPNVKIKIKIVSRHTAGVARIDAISVAPPVGTSLNQTLPLPKAP